MGIRGDFAGLRKMQTQIASIGSTQSRAELARVLMQEALGLVDEGFARSISPKDEPWKPLRLRSGQPLRDTRRLQSSYTGVSNARGFKIGTNVEYAPTHQHGAAIKPKRAKALRFQAGGRFFTLKQATIPAREMLPSGALGPRWRNALTDAAREYVSRKMRR